MPKYFARVRETDYEIVLDEKRGGLWIELNDRPIPVDVATGGDHGNFFSLILNGVSYDITAERINGEYYVTVQGEAYTVEVEDERSRALKQFSDAGPRRQGGPVRSNMPGVITQVLVQEGDVVEVGTPLAILEAMKMENEVRTRVAGTVVKVAVHAGDSVTNNQELFVIE